MGSHGRLRRSDVEDLFTLTPLQQGMLSYAASGLHTFHERSMTSLEGLLNLEAFAAAWQAVVDRHPALRTAFVWKGLQVPHQVVFKRLSLRIRHVDWTRLDPGAQERQLQRLLAAPADWSLERPPLMTIFLVRAGERRFHLVWTISHLLTDAFSFSIVIEDLLQRYRRALEGRPWDPECGPSFREYVAWLKRQDPSPALAEWERELVSHTGRTQAPLAPAGPPTSRVTTREMTLSADLTSALQSSAVRRRTSLFAIYLGSLALVERTLTGASLPLIAIITSCRSLPVTGIESMVGLVMNCVPVPIDLPRHETLARWLFGLDDELQRLLRFEYVPYQQFQEICSMHGRRVEVAFNFLNVNRRPRHGSGFEVIDYRQALSSNFPIGVNVIPGRETQIEVSYPSALFSHAMVDGMLEQWRETLVLVPAGERRVGDVARAVAAAGAALRAADIDERRRESLPEWIV